MNTIEKETTFFGGINDNKQTIAGDRRTSNGM
jgi:hypothetical protein